jgi:hypothetical protein
MMSIRRVLSLPYFETTCLTTASKLAILPLLIFINNIIDIKNLMIDTINITTKDYYVQSSKNNIIFQLKN